MNRSRTLSLISLVVLAVLAAGCGPAPEPEPEADPVVTVENPQLRLRLVEVPGEWVVSVNDGPDLVLGRRSADDSGEVAVLVNPPEDGQNLPEAVRFHHAYIENQDEGDYLGAQELVSQLGTAYYSRGHFQTDGGPVEETVIFTLHPDADRMMRLRYRYPAGIDSSIRVQQLFDLLATVQGLGG